MKFTQASKNVYICLASSAILLILLTFHTGPSEAGQGCPFEDGSCQEYCNQQGCNLGYCGHFAWIQCICRKCGDEWNSYDKIRYKPDEKVNQTELDSLNLNSTGPIILTNSTSSSGSTSNNNNNKTVEQVNLAESEGKQLTQDEQQDQQQQQKPEENKQRATLTTLLIPDLSEPNEKIDPNEVPDENSEKFLDYLAQNHDRLAQATRAAKEGQGEEGGDDGEEEPQSGETTTDETVLIQIDSSQQQQQQQQQPQTTKPQQERQTHEKSPLETTSNAGLMRLVKLAIAERSSEEVN